jgi:solute carrier family 26 (sodium-independent sulfate anion transporter), member 11
VAEMAANEKEGDNVSRPRTEDEELGDSGGGGGAHLIKRANETDSRDAVTGTMSPRRGVITHGLNRPLFYVDLTSALQSAIANVEARAEAVMKVSAWPQEPGH